MYFQSILQNYLKISSRRFKLYLAGNEETPQ
jgi:hypothetical protein